MGKEEHMPGITSMVSAADLLQASYFKALSDGSWERHLKVCQSELRKISAVKVVEMQKRIELMVTIHLGTARMKGNDCRRAMKDFSNALDLNAKVGKDLYTHCSVTSKLISCAAFCQEFEVAGRHFADLLTLISVSRAVAAAAAWEALSEIGGTDAKCRVFEQALRSLAS